MYLMKTTWGNEGLQSCYEKHLFFVLIHPFEDGNGRMSRLLALLTFVSQSLTVLHAVSAIIYDRRQLYYSLLQNVQQDDKLSLFVDALLDFQQEALVKSRQQAERLKQLNKFLSDYASQLSFSSFDQSLLQFVVLKNRQADLIMLEKSFDSDSGSLVCSLSKFEKLGILRKGKISYGRLPIHSVTLDSCFNTHSVY